MASYFRNFSPLASFVLNSLTPVAFISLPMSFSRCFALSLIVEFRLSFFVTLMVISFSSTVMA